jgi:hypothetical protein
MLKVFLFVIAFNSYSSDLIYNYDQITEYREVLEENLGTDYKYLTPLFMENGIPTLYVHRLGGRCNKVKIFNNTIKKSKSKCSINMEYTLDSFPKFKSITNNFSQESENIILSDQEVEAKYPAVSYRYFMRDLHQEGELVTKDFKFVVSAKSFFQITDHKLSLHQEVSFKRSAFFYFSQSIKTISQAISVKDGDILFSNNEGAYILFKRYQPKTFRFKFLTLNPNYENYLDTIPNRLFSDRGLKYCFVDYFTDHSPYDCEALATKGPAMVQMYQNFNLLYIEPKRGEISIL